VIVSVLLLIVTLFFLPDAKSQNLGPNVNTDGDEYINALLSDGSRIYFTRRQGDDKVFFSVVKDGNCQLAQLVDFGWTHDIRMGAVSFSTDMKTVYFVGIEYPGGFGRGDIYKSELIDNKWGNPINLGLPVNSATMESQPCISANGKELYFVRDTKNYKSNIYCSRRLADGRWDKPSAVTAANTRFGEMAPFLHPDGLTLFFASEGHDGLGGYDIFVCRRLLGGGWSEPVNLGAPVNTEKNEISFVVSADGKKCYVSSDRDGGFGGYDIYVFDYDDVNVPEIVDTTHFVMRNIQFEFDSAVLSESSDAAIDSLANFLNDNPLINIEIAGFTDNSGTEEHNQKLSFDRANAVKEALIYKGITADRLKAIGFGSNNPIAPNDSEEHKALNRRVEIVLKLSD
jgi:Outer membrane protein and related peptidoglycan-associated (lipo)proteins